MSKTMKTWTAMLQPPMFRMLYWSRSDISNNSIISYGRAYGCNGCPRQEKFIWPGGKSCWIAIWGRSSRGIHGSLAAGALTTTIRLLVCFWWFQTYKIAGELLPGCSMFRQGPSHRMLCQYLATTQMLWHAVKPDSHFGFRQRSRGHGPR